MYMYLFLHFMFVSSFSFFLFFFFSSKTFYPSPSFTGNPHFVECSSGGSIRSRVDQEIIDVSNSFLSIPVQRLWVSKSNDR